MTQQLFKIINGIGFVILALGWLFSGNIQDFFIMLFIICMTLLRWRFAKLQWTIIMDTVVCAVLNPVLLVLPMFSVFYYGRYADGALGSIMAIIVNFEIISILEPHEIQLFVFYNMPIFIMIAFAGIAGLFLGLWEKSHEKGQKSRDQETSKYYEMEVLQKELLSATAQIERMTVVSERARISREIHDNAGHEIVAAYMSLQTARPGFNNIGIDPDILSLYDLALERLEKGANKVREVVHNLAPVTTLGVEVLQEICKNFIVPVEFKIFGNTSYIPVHGWGVLESCLNESLTNAAKHAHPKEVKVTLDVTSHIARLCIENDGVLNAKKTMGNGLRNLRHRATAVGGSLVVTTGEVFRVICIVPIEE